MVDRKHGGFFGRIDGTNRLHSTANKGIILNTRILWTFSSIYLSSRDPADKSIADRAYHYLVNHFLDKEMGGFFWMLDFKGLPVDKKKQIYAHAFAIYALTEYYKVNSEEKVLQLAVANFNLIEKYSFDNENNGYLEAFDRSWQLLEDYRLSEKDENEVKTMNTHLHILEAYTNLYSVWQNDGLAGQLEKLIRLFLKKFIDNSGHFNLFFDEKWNLKSTRFSFGHDIEGGWLLYEASVILGKVELVSACKSASVKMTDAALTGLDDDGGLMNEGNPSGIEDADKHWWPQAEALVGLVNAWQITNKKKYLDLAQRVWEFINEKIVDHEFGEWHWMISKEGNVDKGEDKAGPWKCPYHNGRAMLELIRRLPE